STANPERCHIRMTEVSTTRSANSSYISFAVWKWNGLETAARDVHLCVVAVKKLTTTVVVANQREYLGFRLTSGLVYRSRSALQVWALTTVRSVNKCITGPPDQERD